MGFDIGKTPTCQKSGASNCADGDFSTRTEGANDTDGNIICVTCGTQECKKCESDGTLLTVRDSGLGGPKGTRNDLCVLLYWSDLTALGSVHLYHH